MATVADTAEVQSQIIGDRSRKDLSAEQKEKRKLAKRIIKAIQPSLEDSMRRESELCRRPFEKELRDLDMLLETSLSSRRDSMTGSVMEDISDEETENKKAVVNSTAHVDEDHPMTNGDTGHAREPEVEPITNGIQHEATDATQAGQPSDHTLEASNDAVPATNQPPPVTDQAPSTPKGSEPSIPRLSSGTPSHPTALSQGGIPWYMEPFDPHGTTIYEERWTGREVARGMSEELSDVDEDEVDGLADGSIVGDVESAGLAVGGEGDGDAGVGTEGAGKKVERRKNGRVKKRWRGFR